MVVSRPERSDDKESITLFQTGKYRYAIKRLLNPSAITRITQAVSEEHKQSLFVLRGWLSKEDA